MVWDIVFEKRQGRVISIASDEFAFCRTRVSRLKEKIRKSMDNPISHKTGAIDWMGVIQNWKDPEVPNLLCRINLSSG